MKNNYLLIVLLISSCLCCQLSAQTALTITSITPTCNALNVAKNTNITITFTTDINQSTLSNSTIKINGSLSGLRSSNFNYNSSTKTATISPNTPFIVGELVTVALTRGIKNANGDSLSTGYSWSFTIKTNACSGLFYESSTTGVGNTPWGVAVADFDGDGDIDAATSNYGSNSISILKNDGSGSFTLSSTVTGLSTPVGIRAADFDGDGAIDLAVTNSSSGTVSIFKNNGAGIFTLSSTVNVGVNPRNLEAVDINGDGAIDLVVPNMNSNTVTILKNDGRGIFTTNQTVNVGAQPQYILVADINNDGYIDLIVSGSTITILHNNGSGMFTSTIFESAGAYAMADMDGDGYVDMMVMDDVTNTVTVLKNNGSGTFTQLSTVKVGNTPWQAVAADLDGDGDIDVCVGNNYGNNVSIVKNNGSGTLTQTSLVGVGSYPGGIAAADVDGNGTIDLIIANSQSNNISILKNRSSSATINTSSSLLSFGSLSVGSSKSAYLKIYNEGIDSSLIVSNITASNPAFTVNRTSLTIAALKYDTILVTFQPTTKGTIFNDSLMITSNDAKRPNAKVFLTGSSSSNQPKVFFSINLKGPIYAGISVLGDNAMYAIASGDAVYRLTTAGSVAYTLQVAGDIRSSSSIAYDTTVYIASSDRNLYAFSKNGNSIWSLPTGGVLTATPVIDSIANRLYIGVSNHNFIAINRSTGKVDWNYFADGEIRNSGVVTSNRKLIFATQKGTLYGFDLKNFPLPTTPTWQMALPDTAPSSFAVDNEGCVYLGTRSGILLKVSLPADKQPEIVWQLFIGHSIVAAPVIDANGLLYVGSTDSKLYAVRISTGLVKWSFSTSGPIQSTPTISVGGNIFLANDSGEVYSLDSNKVIQWRYKTNASIVSPLLYYKSTLYFGTLDNRVIALYDSSQSLVLTKSSGTVQAYGYPMWSTFQGNNQRTGMASISNITGIGNDNSGELTDFVLLQNYPNPFNPSTVIAYELPKSAEVSLKVFNTLGQQLLKLVDSFQLAGHHEVTLDTKFLPSGIYFYRLTAGSFLQTKKMAVLK